MSSNSVKPQNVSDQECLTATKIVLDISPTEVEKKCNIKCWSLAPMLQGVIMETVQPEVAEQLHALPFNPYSQYCIAEDDKLVWVINALSNSVQTAVVDPVLNATDLHIKRFDLPLSWHEVSQTKLPREDLSGLIYGDDTRRFTLRFLIPTSFKSSGNYQVIPNLHFIYQNLLMHYSQVFESSHEADSETVAYLVDHTRIVNYNLCSRYFLLGGTKIPAFMGSMAIETNGPQSLVGFVHMLLRFGAFSGLGIKTSMGMGGLQVT